MLYVIGDNAEVARYSGVDVVRTRLVLFTVSSLVAGMAGILFAARLGTVRGDMANGFELEIITIVLLGGVSIFGGSGRMSGVLLAVLIVLNLRNGFGLANVGGNTQTGVIGAILIGSVLAQNLIERLGDRSRAPGDATSGRHAVAARADAERPAHEPDLQQHPRSHVAQQEGTMKFTRMTAALVAALGTRRRRCGDDDDDADRHDALRRPTRRRRPTRPPRPSTGRDRAPAATERRTGTDGAPAAAVTSPASCCRSAPASPSSTRPTRAPSRPPASSASPRPSSSGPASCTDSTGQVEFVTNAVTQGVDAIMVSNNAGDQIEPAVAGRGRSRHRGRQLGLADPVGRGREPVRRPGRLRRDRHR